MIASPRPAVFVRQFGTGSDPYFCLHGWQADHLTFAPLLSHLPPTARLYAADLPGFGLSALPAAWTLQTVTDEIASAFGTPRPQSLTLVGEGLGALLGMRAALKRPELFRRLVLVNTFARVPWHFPLTADPAYRSILAEIPSLGEFARLDVPVDIIFGSRSSRAVRASAPVWLDLWNRARTWEVPQMGHNLLAEAPEIVSTLIFEGSKAPVIRPVPARRPSHQSARY
jgi:pimeloyl-ACP methyl ester carboxylesterase